LQTARRPRAVNVSYSHRANIGDTHAFACLARQAARAHLLWVGLEVVRCVREDKAQVDPARVAQGVFQAAIQLYFPHLRHERSLEGRLDVSPILKQILLHPLDLRPQAKPGGQSAAARSKPGGVILVDFDIG